MFSFEISGTFRDLVPNVYKQCSNGWPKRRSNQLECFKMDKSEKRFSQSVYM